MKPSLPENFRLSPSGLSSWRSCRRRWWFHYVEQLPPGEPGVEAVAGTFVHAVLHDLLGDEPAERTLERAREHAGRLWDWFLTEPAWTGLGDADRVPMDFKARCWNLLLTYFMAEDPMRVRVVDREFGLEVDLGGVPFRGYVDRLADSDDGLVVTDYKTGKPPEPGKPWTADNRREKLLQVLLYGAGVREASGATPGRVRLLYFTMIDGRRVTDEIARNTTDEDFDEVVDGLGASWSQMLQAVEAGVMPEPSTGALCAWCPYVALCPEGTAEVLDRWGRTKSNGDPMVRDDAPAVALLGLVRPK